MKKGRSYELLPLFESFIRDSKSGRRKKVNGERISSNTISTYDSTLLHLKSFVQEQPLRVVSASRLGKREMQRERTYWGRFRLKFTQHLHKQGLLDNTVGLHFKNLKAFFRYLILFKDIEPGPFWQRIAIPKEETPIVVLSEDRLKFLLHNEVFKESLPANLRYTLDTFVLGCTIGLRFSDLMRLRKSNLERTEKGTYLINKSAKTKTLTRVKLPEYAIQVLKSFKPRGSFLVPQLSLNQFNANLKKIFELAGWTEVIGRKGSRNGKERNLRKSDGDEYRFCDLASSHMMRKTAITTMLLLGMPEPLVRKISGHAPGSKEFYRYVKYTQTYLDEHTEKVFNQLA